MLGGKPEDGRASVKIPVDRPFVSHASPSGTNSHVHKLQIHFDHLSDAGFERQQVDLLPFDLLIRNLC